MQNTLLSVSMLWLPGDAKPVVAILGIMQGLVCAVVDLVIASLFPILQASMFEVRIRCTCCSICSHLLSLRYCVGAGWYCEY